MSADAYLQAILAREAVDTGPYSAVRGVQGVVEPIVRAWAGNMLVGVTPSGSFAKGTANSSGTDIDLFISLSDQTKETLKEIYEGLYSKVQASGYTAKAQNVSIGITVSGYSVDLVPAKRQGPYGEDHSLYRRRAATWTKTNVQTHIAHVIRGGRTQETRVIKLWRDQVGLDFPSVYLELTVIDALAGQRAGLADNVWTVLRYLRDSFPTARVMDPANTNNVISDELSATERARVQAAADRALKAKSWSEVVR
jgi:hypothetical protein